MATSGFPGEAPVGLNEARAWLRLGAATDDAVVAQLIRAATNICEAFIGQWLIEREGEESLPLRAGGVRLAVRPVISVETVALVSADGAETAADETARSVAIARDGSATVRVADAGEAVRLRVAYRAGLAADANAVPEAIRQGILRMMQHLYEARDGGAAPPAAVAVLWQPWRRLTLGGGQ